MRQHKKPLQAFLLVSLLITIIGLSIGMAVVHSHHECQGKDCPVCAGLNLAETELTEWKSVIQPAHIFVVVHPVFSLIKALSTPFTGTVLFFSLVTLKMRFNN